MNLPERHLVHKVVHRPLTWGLGLDLSIPRWAVLSGGAGGLLVFMLAVPLGINPLAALGAGVGLCALVCAGGLVCLRHDPQMLQVLAAALAVRTCYDPAKYATPHR